MVALLAFLGNVLFWILLYSDNTSDDWGYGFLIGMLPVLMVVYPIGMMLPKELVPASPSLGQPGMITLGLIGWTVFGFLIGKIYERSSGSKWKVPAFVVFGVLGALSMVALEVVNSKLPLFHRDSWPVVAVIVAAISIPFGIICWSAAILLVSYSLFRRLIG